jgi:hypothetical protein
MNRRIGDNRMALPRMVASDQTFFMARKMYA